MHSIDVERVEHSVKTAIACLIGLAITKSIHIGVDQWLIVTILVVMCAQINVGSMLQKSYMRFLGTLAGSLLSMLTLIFFGTHTTAVAVTIAIAAMLFSFIATSTKRYNESGTLGAATVVIILLGQHPTLVTAVERFLEISLGILIAALASQFIFPIHARNHLRRNQAETLLMLRDYYQTTFLDTTLPETHHFIDEDIAKSLIKQRKLAAEAKQELFGAAFNLHQFRQCLWCEKEILRSIVFMYHAYQVSYAKNSSIAKINGLKEFHESICHALEKIAQGINQQKEITSQIPSIESLKSMLNKLFQDAIEDEKIALNAFLFCTEILLTRLNKLMTLINQNQPKFGTPSRAR